MKTKKIQKKLVLGKNTIANLNANAMERVYGGVINTVEVCYTKLGTNCLCPTGETRCEPCSS